MKNTEHPTTVAEVGVALHVAEYLLGQAQEVLSRVRTAPKLAAPSPVWERSGRAEGLAGDAVKVIRGRMAVIPELDFGHEQTRYKVFDFFGDKPVLVDAFEDLDGARKRVSKAKEGQSLLIVEERTSFSRRVIE